MKANGVLEANVLTPLVPRKNSHRLDDQVLSVLTHDAPKVSDRMHDDPTANDDRKGTDPVRVNADRKAIVVQTPNDRVTAIVARTEIGLAKVIVRVKATDVPMATAVRTEIDVLRVKADEARCHGSSDCSTAITTDDSIETNLIG